MQWKSRMKYTFVRKGTHTNSKNHAHERAPSPSSIRTFVLSNICSISFWFQDIPAGRSPMLPYGVRFPILRIYVLAKWIERLFYHQHTERLFGLSDNLDSLAIFVYTGSNKGGYYAIPYWCRRQRQRGIARSVPEMRKYGVWGLLQRVRTRRWSDVANCIIVSSQYNRRILWSSSKVAQSSITGTGVWQFTKASDFTSSKISGAGTLVSAISRPYITSNWH